MVGRVVRIGWIDHSVMAYISAISLARHKISSREMKVVPFVIDSDSICDTVACNSAELCYAIGTFSDKDIDALISRNLKLSVIGKLYGKKYGRLFKPVRVGTVKLYPVQKTRLHGLEYLSVLSTYFGMTETSVFVKLSNMSLDLARILTATDGWLDMFHLLTSTETVSSAEDIDRVVEHFKKVNGFEEKYREIIEAVSRTIVEETKNHIILDMRSPQVPVKKAKMVARYVLNNKPAMFIITSDNDGYRIMVLYKRTLRPPILSGLQVIFSASLEGVYGNVAYFRSTIKDWGDLIEKTRAASSLLLKKV